MPRRQRKKVSARAKKLRAARYRQNRKKRDLALAKFRARLLAAYAKVRVCNCSPRSKSWINDAGHMRRVHGLKWSTRTKGWVKTSKRGRK